MGSFVCSSGPRRGERRTRSRTTLIRVGLTTVSAKRAVSAAEEIEVEPDQPLVLRFGGSLVEQLGAQLYPSVTATVAELISNAWDADAKNVWITIPFDEDWSKGSEIVVMDDGHGMTRTAAQYAYLIVGRRRRMVTGDLSEGGRPVHGRKGIGKLAAFGTAGYLECATLRDGTFTTFGLDYNSLREMDPDEDYPVEDIENPAPLVKPDGETLPHGTRITLTQLRMKRQISESTFMTSMSRRFAIKDMNVLINGKPLQRFDIPLQYRFPKDAAPEGVEVDAEGWGTETLPGDPAGRQVRWWIGFTEKPLTEGDMQGVSILARDKMAQRPFKFERSQGTTAQLGLEYLVGEVQADWLDEGNDIETDFIQSNRDQLQLEDARLEPFLEWGRKRLTWALRRRQEMRADDEAKSAETNEELVTMLGGFTKGEQRAFLGVAAKLARVPEIQQGDVTTIMRSVIDSRSEVQVREMMERIEEEEDPIQERMWKLVAEFGLIDARRLASVIEARLATIDKLQAALEGGAKEVPDIHNIVMDDAWLLDPRWHLLGHEVDVAKLPGVEFEPEKDETGHELDFLFALAPAEPAPRDQVVVVEIKRGTHPNGTVRKANLPEVQKFQAYVAAVEQHYSNGNSNPPVVSGLMVASGYTLQAEPIRKQLEQIGSPRLNFKTWETVLDETERMHLGWLNVSRGRSSGGEGA